MIKMREQIADIRPDFFVLFFCCFALAGEAKPAHPKVCAFALIKHFTLFCCPSDEFLLRLFLVCCLVP